MNKNRSRARPNELILGHIAGVFGVTGEVRLFLLNPASDLFDVPREVTLAHPDSGRRVVTLEARPGAGKRVIGRVQGVTTAEEAATLVGAEMLIERAQLPDPGADTWYHTDLLHVPVRTASGEELGTLDEIHTGPSVDVWVVNGPLGERYIPAFKSNIVRVVPGVEVVVTDEAGQEPL